MYFRGALLKNDSNFYFAEYDRKKAGDDGEEPEPLDNTNTTIHRNPAATVQQLASEEETPLTPRPSKGAEAEDEQPKLKMAEKVRVKHGACEIMEDHRGLLTLLQTERLQRDQDLQLNQARIKDTLDRAQVFMDAMSILGATLERSTMSATKLLHQIPQTNFEITEHSASIMAKLIELEPFGLAPIKLNSPLAQKGGSERDGSRASQNGRKMSRKKGGRGGLLSAANKGFQNPLFNSTEPTTEYGSA